MPKRSLRVILNGKKAGLSDVRKAVNQVRQDGHAVDVRVTWEAGDAGRFAAEALDDGVDVIVAAGGDGTVNEVVNGIFNVTDRPEPAMGIMPLGSANDFARGCGVATDATEALRFAAIGEPRLIDVGRVNDTYFVNSVVMGFGAEVTFRTSERLKKTIQGAAYGITGFLLALRQTIYTGKVRFPDGTEPEQRKMVFAAVSNGIQAGGHQLAPRAKLDDGLLDLFSVPYFDLERLPTIMRDVNGLKNGREPEFIRYRQIEWYEVEADLKVPVSPDGEELELTKWRTEALKQRLPAILPESSLFTSQ